MTSFRTIGLWVVLIALFIAFYQVFQHTEDVVEVSFTALLDDVRDHKVLKLRIKGARYSGTYAETGIRFRAAGPVPDAALLTTFKDAGVDVSFDAPEEPSLWTSILSQWMPVVFLFLFFIFFMRQLQGKGVKLPGEQPRTPEALVDPGPLRGLDEARARLRAAAEGVKNGKPGTRRVLLSGPPGTGKTALVRAAVADSGLKAIVVASSEFVELFVGTGAKRVRELFETAKKAAPVMIVIEDVDGIAKSRVQSSEKTQDEREQTLIELCQWLDGLKKFPDRVLLVATTNRPDLLDAAIVRPGRFEVHVKLTAEGATVEG